ncbi:hypothetical protein C8F01DRAFT_1209381 [Mycena amicta]|nr:hypothetical protein C8F01DRAFT_1209381 [Mycena amicta]
MGTAAALTVRGFIPCAPERPSVAITVQALEFYRVAHARCPQLAIEAFVKTLCDLHSLPYRPYLRTQFSIAYDLYLDLRRSAERLVLVALERDKPKWCLKHACPACMYTLEGEDDLIFKMLVTMDGNDSLKRVLRRERVVQEDGQEKVVGQSAEQEDNRDVGEGYFLTRARVNRWAKDRMGKLLPMDDNVRVYLLLLLRLADSEQGIPNPCAPRWQNMIEDITSKMWGVFDETGIFLCICRHGFILLIVDMIKSGELSKYPLAVIEELLMHFGEGLGAGYDIGCNFKITVKHSALGPAAERLCLRCLVGSFHGHAHNRLCQLQHLPTYVKGMGLEDLEGCEHCFSRSNGLARSCRYASRFHRQQEISAYFKHNDAFETYASLSGLLCKKYKSALAILETEPALPETMSRHGIEDITDFETALKDEEAFLLDLRESSKSKEETTEMEYLRRLEKLEDDLSALFIFIHFYSLTPLNIKLRHVQELVKREMAVVHDVESELLVVARWTRDSPEWQATVDAVRSHAFRKAVDGLELLVVQRLLELTKMNRSGTGYKMRKHIAKALQARSKAIRSAIKRYNSAAAAMFPPKPTLSWEEVVHYTFLSDFDLLRDDKNTLQGKRWATPMFRFIMDNFFKIERAREEVQRLNIEICRVVTWIRDEGRFLRSKERALRNSGDLELAWSIFNKVHMERFQELVKMDGFTGSLEPGTSVEKWPAMDDSEVEMEVDELQSGQPDVDDEEYLAGQEDDQQEEVSDLFYQISRLGLDPAQRGQLLDD